MKNWGSNFKIRLLIDKASILGFFVRKFVSVRLPFFKRWRLEILFEASFKNNWDYISSFWLLCGSNLNTRACKKKEVWASISGASPKKIEAQTLIVGFLMENSGEITSFRLLPKEIKIWIRGSFQRKFR